MSNPPPSPPPPSSSFPRFLRRVRHVCASYASSAEVGSRPVLESFVPPQHSTATPCAEPFGDFFFFFSFLFALMLWRRGPGCIIFWEGGGRGFLGEECGGTSLCVGLTLRMGFWEHATGIYNTKTRKY
ncbi:hypothetical protein BDW02DRAFT_196678 [Decorospora gaudefroyi]|uniref:Uncharacterized protein n=1 Tax=Decorospora gaudefroyi TaxID=184978 RepID=A0A6A5KNE0_9PLEO|nr:hypothetical protein BDW02DRAFT_196678 [Decorospora gaudefroyi]